MTKPRRPGRDDGGSDGLWQRASELFVETLDLDEAQRASFVEERSAGDDALRAEVLALLAAHDQEGILDGAFGAPAMELDLQGRVADALAGRYRIAAKLGEGGSAVVFLAWETKHDRRVVLKVMRPEAEIVYGHDRFLEEVRVASALSHPHILAFIDSGRADGLLYYVMPHVEGETLYELLEREKSLSLSVASALLHDIAEALAYAHEQHIVHRDLKPGNVLCAGAHAYLMDFGVAKALRGAPPGQPRTRAGFVPGTPRYMAPEQMDGRGDIGPEADVFAWGQLAHECLTGSVLPPPWATEGDVRSRLLRARPDLAPGLAGAVASALAVEPEARPSAADLVRIMEDTAGSVGREAPSASLPADDPRRSARWRAAAALVTVVVAVAVFAVLRMRDATTATALGPFAVAEFRNETGDSTLDFIGRMAGDWVTQGLQQVGSASVVPWPMALAASGRARAQGESDPAPMLLRETGARTVVSGAFYRIGDEVRFQAEVIDPAARSVLVALDPVSAPLDRPEEAVRELRDRVMGSVAVLSGGWAAGLPDLVNRAPTFDAYRVFDRGLASYIAQEYSAATPAFLEAYALDTTFMTSLLYGATTAWNEGDRHVTDSLVQVLEPRRAQLSEYDDLRWRFLSAVLRGDGQDALRVLRRSVDIAPESRAAYNLARLAVMTNRPSEAIEVLDMIDPDVGEMRGWAQYWTQATHALHLLSRFDEEVEAAREMVRRHPERSLAPVLEARALAAAGRVEELDSALQAGAVLPPRTYWSHGGALVAAGEELLAHGSRSLGETHLRRALEWLDGQIAAAPDYLAHQYWRGSALYDLGRWAEALDQFEAVLRVDPGSTSYRGMAAVAAARMGDRERTEHHLDEGRWGYEVADRLMYAARAAAILGDMDRSLALLAEALDRGSAGFPWMHASGHHDFVILRTDARIARVLAPDS